MRQPPVQGWYHGSHSNPDGHTLDGRVAATARLIIPRDDDAAVPPIHEYHCDTCEFEMPSGWGGYMYVQATVCSTCGGSVDESQDACDGCGTPVDAVEGDGYTRVVCPHPMEHVTVDRVLGEDVSEATRAERTGFNAYCVCRNCLSQFELDTERDERRCPDCGGRRVATLRELVGEDCPNCAEGTFVEGESRGVA
jgi:DNA-directed RNA polymerase subunit RPC12/RpoP